MPTKMHSSRDPVGPAYAPARDIWHPAELRQVMSRPDIINHIFTLMDSSGSDGDYLAEPHKHIYSVKVVGSMLAYSPGSIMDGPGRMGQIFHSELYSADRNTLRKAIDQFLRNSGGVIVGLCLLDANQITQLALIDSERAPSA